MPCRTRVVFWLSLACLAVGMPVGAADMKDADGAPLPRGAVARLGSVRFRSSTSPVLLPDGKTMLVEVNSEIVAVDVKTGIATGKKWKIGDGIAMPSSISGNGKRAASIANQTITIWSLEDGKKLLDIKQLANNYQPVSFSADGKLIAFGGFRPYDKMDEPIFAKVWSIDDEREICQVKPAQNNSCQALLSADGKLLVTWGHHFEPFVEGKKQPDPEESPSLLLQIWNPETSKLQATAKIEHGYSINSVAISPDGRLIAVSGSGITFVDAKTGKIIRQYFGSGDNGISLRFSPDGSILATSDYIGNISRWQVSTGKLLDSTKIPRSRFSYGIANFQFTSDQELIACKQQYQEVITWRVPEGKRLAPRHGPVAPVHAVAFVDDDKQVLTASEEGEVQRWDAATGDHIRDIRLKRPVNYREDDEDERDTSGAEALHQPASFSADGKSFYRFEHMFSVTDLSTGQERLQLPFVTNSACVAPDGQQLVAFKKPMRNQTNKIIRAYLMTTDPGEIHQTLKLGAGDMIASAFGSDGKTLAVAIAAEADKPKAKDKAKTRRVLTGWNIASGKKLSEFVLGETHDDCHMVMARNSQSVIVTISPTEMIEVDIISGTKIRDFATSPSKINGMVLSPDSKQIATYTNGKTRSIRVYNWATGKVESVFTGYDADIITLAFSKNGKKLITGSTDTTAMIWDLAAKTIE